MTPSFFKDKKYERFIFQWNIRLGLEQVKLKQAFIEKKGDKQQQKEFKEELLNYLEHAEDQRVKYEMQDVYVTDHNPKEKRYATTSAQEDEDFYKYQQSLKEYNSKPTPAHVLHAKPKYEKGTLLQRMFDPFASA